MPMKPPRILAIDPGEEESGLVLFSGKDEPIVAEVKKNNLVLLTIQGMAAGAFETCTILAIECAAGYGTQVSMNLIKTIEWYGRFAQAWLENGGGEANLPPLKVPRRLVKEHLDGAKTDAQVRDAIIHRWGGLGASGGKRGSKTGPLANVHTHCIQALGVAVTVQEQWERTAFERFR